MFVRPVETEDELQNLENLDESKLRPEFLKKILSTRKKIYSKIKPKTLNGKVLNGQMFAELCKNYVEIVNSGAVPNIDSAWNNIVKNETYNLYKSIFFLPFF